MTVELDKFRFDRLCSDKPHVFLDGSGLDFTSFNHSWCEGSRNPEVEKLIYALDDWWEINTSIKIY